MPAASSVQSAAAVSTPMPTPMPTPKAPLVALLGDTHGNLSWARGALHDLADAGIEVVLQLGDFGWWPPNKFEHRLSNAAARLGLDVCFIDGNHEHHLDLRRYAASRSQGQPGPVEMMPRLWYLPRGYAWRWHGRRFAALGGAYSVDQGSRTPGLDWWPEETPSLDEADLTAAPGKADVFVCHDIPDFGGWHPPSFPVAERHERGAAQSRGVLAYAARRLQPELVVHGHWHTRHASTFDTDWGPVRVEGLNRDTKTGAVALLDLDTLEVTDFTPVSEYRTITRSTARN